jgi:translocation and assembly module TamB
MKGLVAVVAAIGLAILMALAGVAWVFGTEGGLRWAVARAQAAAGGKLTIEGASGALARAVFIEKLSYESEGLSVLARGVAARADLMAALAGRLSIEPLEAESLEIALAETPGKPPSPPLLPFGMRIASAHIARLDLRQGAARHRLLDVRLSHAELGATRPVAISLAGSFTRPDERFPAKASVTLRGSLERIDASVSLNVAGVPGEARAVATPFQPRKLASLEARAGPVDLARFHDGLPRTALTATLKAQSALAQGFAGTLALTNAAPGPLDERRLPIAAAETRFSSTDMASAALERLHIALAGGGTLEGRGEASAQRFQAALQASGIDLRAIRSTLRRTQLNGPLRVAVEGERQSLEGTLSQEGITLSADMVRTGETLEVRTLRAAAGAGELSGAATLRLGEALAFEGRFKLERFNPAAFGDYPEASLNGSLIAEGGLGGNAQVGVQWALRESSLFGRALQSSGAARISRDRVTQAQAEATLGKTWARLRGDFGRAGDELLWALEVTSLGELAPGLAGRLSATGTLTGAWADPRAVFTAQAEALQLGRGMRLDSVNAKVSGSLLRHDAELSAKTQGLQLEARLRGGWRGGNEGWVGELQALEAAGSYPLRLTAPAALKFSRQRVELGRFEAALADGRLLVREASWQKERLSSSGEFHGLPAQWLVLASGLEERLRSTMLLDGQWSLASVPRLEGSLQLRRASGDLAIQADEGLVTLELSSATLEARFAGVGAVIKASAASRLATLALDGEIAPAPQAGGIGIAPDSPVAFRARVELAELRTLAQPFLAEARLDGRLSVELKGSGTLGEPRLAGTLRGDAIAFDFPPYGVYLKNGELRGTLEGDRLRISDFSIQGSSGRFSVSGTLPLRLADGAAKLAWRARDFAVLDRPDLRLVTSGEGEAGFDGKRFSLTGELRAERGYFEFERERLPRLGDDVVILGQAKPKEERARLPVALDVQLDLGNDLAIRVQGLEGKLTGRAQLATNREGELRMYGRLTTVNATFFAYGQKLEVDPGVLLFDGPIDNPSLQITAWRRNQAVEAGVQLTGTARAPRMQLVSQPPVPEGERLSWLVLGRPPSDATQADLGLLQAAAAALVSRGDAMPVDRRLARAVGLDEVSFRGTGEVQDRVVAFGKRLSDRLYISYEQGLGAVATNLVKLDLSLTQRLSLRAETGTSSGLGFFYRFSWD